MCYHIANNKYLFNRTEQHNTYKELAVMQMYAEGSIKTSANLMASESWRTRRSCPHNLWLKQSHVKFKYTLNISLSEYAIYQAFLSTSPIVMFSCFPDYSSLIVQPMPNHGTKKKKSYLTHKTITQLKHKRCEANLKKS